MPAVTDNKNKKQLTAGANVLQALFENGKTPLSVQFIRWKLWKRWPEFVGETMAQVCEPVGYKNGTLYVWVKNSTWMQQMVFMRDPLRATINKKLEIQYVNEICLTMDRRSVPRNASDSDALRESIANIMKNSPED